MDKALKQRLVGATVLVALAVLILPMLLGGEQETAQEAQTIELPPRPSELSFQTRRFPIGEPDPTTPSELPPSPPPTLPAPLAPAQQTPSIAAARRGESLEESDGSPAAEQSSAAETADGGPPEAGDQGVGGAPAQTAPGETGDPAPAVQPDAPTVMPETPASAVAADGRYLVQVASFSSTGNAERLSERMRSQGLAVLNDTVQTDAGVLHRVRLGPYATEDDASRIVRQLTRDMPDLRPRVLDLRPGQAAPVTASADPLVRWMVQLGSFSERENADQLVFQLRDAGYRASSAAVSSGGATSYKVRVGPVLDRADAVTLAEEIRSGLGIDGLVMSAE